jgi:hypothetical protein
MTSTVNAITLTTISSQSYDAISFSLSSITALLLVLLLIEKELVRAYGGTSSVQWLRVLDTIIFPLLVAISTIIVVRILDIMR